MSSSQSPHLCTLPSYLSLSIPVNSLAHLIFLISISVNSLAHFNFSSHILCWLSLTLCSLILLSTARSPYLTFHLLISLNSLVHLIFPINLSQLSRSRNLSFSKSMPTLSLTLDLSLFQSLSTLFRSPNVPLIPGYVFPAIARSNELQSWLFSQPTSSGRLSNIGVGYIHTLNSFR